MLVGQRNGAKLPAMPRLVTAPFLCISTPLRLNVGDVHLAD